MYPASNKNTKGEIRTLDLTGMSRALSPTELPWHKIYKNYCYINIFKSKDADFISASKTSNPLFLPSQETFYGNLLVIHDYQIYDDDTSLHASLGSRIRMDSLLALPAYELQKINIVQITRLKKFLTLSTITF